MIIQIFATYCRAAEFALQMQQETFRLWLSPWCSAVAPAAGGRRTEPARVAPERRPETGPEVRNDRREALNTPSESGVWTHEAARRSPEAAVIHRQNGHGEALAAAPAARIGEDTRIQLREEQLHVRKHLVAAGEVRVRKEVRTEHRTIEVPVSREEVVIERRAPAEAPVTAADFAPGEVIRIPLMREQVVVEKRPVVREEVRVSKRVVQETERVGGEVRKEEVRIERIECEANGSVPTAARGAEEAQPRDARAPSGDELETPAQSDDEAQILRRAYFKWIDESRPDGQDRRHYFGAAREVQA